MTVSKWRHRFAADRLDGLVNAPRPGAALTIGYDVVEVIVVESLEPAPPNATHWSTRDYQRNGTCASTACTLYNRLVIEPR